MYDESPASPWACPVPVICGSLAPSPTYTTHDVHSQQRTKLTTYKRIGVQNARHDTCHESKKSASPDFAPSMKALISPCV
ncbi:hypothetical protein GCM10012286_50200 [Streptomyces lasiicapitis]|uniref:Uncharacterized protein n=1 Tax=Streptomyces lasiicapitis TaxID=1923961 RepID=A0ABQ2MEG1_9ACTN|nr:hypothetical protein GCM10012286_50200 [Streptomyces lasiicapitis]